MVVAERAGRGGRGSSFRLSGRDSVSSASLYKQRIDSMFDEERSVISHTYGVTQQPQSTGSRSARNKALSISGRLDGPGGLGQSVEGMRARTGSHGDGSLRREGSTGNNPAVSSIGQRNGNSVQASIERMFSELAMETDSSNTGTHTFTVDYLGSTPLPRRVTSLAGLQAPLSKLYLAYRRTKPIGTLQNSPELAARLDISRAGLHVRHSGPKGELEQLNPFPTIAVWSAVKFVLQPSEEDTNVIEYAFLPLITDPDNIDKQALFRNLELSEKKYILGRDGNSHSPLFTVVMRKIGVAKQLECHGFVCQTSEDAIVIAATLYKSLMAHMSRVPRVKGGITGPSIASSSAAPVRPPRRKRTPSIVSNDSDRNSSRLDTLTKTKSLKNRRTPERIETSPPPPPPPNKLSGIDQVKAKLAQIKNANETNSDKERGSNTPPKSIYNESMDFLSKQHKHSEKNSKESSLRSKVSEKIEMFSGLEKVKDIPRPLTVPPPVPVKPKKDVTPVKAISTPKCGPMEPLRRSHSMRNSSEPGDILTKVAIPRSGSFLNASGLSRYKSTGQRNNGKKGGGSPLGFSELFNEFRVQEDLHSMDDILGAIIDAEGMSFNDLKPIYKEFLLKLAVTLTKDELFQHSKAIMRRQKKKLLRRNSTVQNKRKKMLIGAKGLKMVFRKPFGKDLLKSKILNLGEKKISKPTNPFEIPKQTTNKNNIIVTSESSVSTSSYDLRQFHPKEVTPNQTPKRQSIKRRNSKRSETSNLIGKTSKRHGKGRNVERVSTSEDSDFLTLSRRVGCQNRNSSSGYVSCSECESESCADRCYCAAKARPRPPPEPAPLETSCGRDEKCCECTAGESSQCYSCCGCDTESCADSDKCYCRTVPGMRHMTINSRHSRGTNRHSSVIRHPSAKHHGHVSTCKSGKCPQGRSHRSPRRRSVPGPATLDSLYYEPLRPKARSVLNHTSAGLEFLTKRNSRFDTFERMSCSTEVGRPSTGLTPGGRKSYSSDNLHLDYDLFLSNRGMSLYGSRGGSMHLPVMMHRSKEALITHKEAEVGALFSDGRLLSARRGLYRGPSAALADTLGYLP